MKKGGGPNPPPSVGADARTRRYSQLEQDQVELLQALPDHVELLHVEPLQVLPDHVEPLHVEPLQVEPDQVLPDQVEPLHVEPLHVLPFHVPPLHVEPLAVNAAIDVESNVFPKMSFSPVSATPFTST
jgi:hypothetical protein